MIVWHRKSNILNTKVSSLSKLFLVFTLIYNSNSFYITVNSTLGIILLIAGILILLFIHKGNIDKRVFYIIMACTTMAFFSMVANGALEYLGTTIRFILTIIYAILLAQELNIQELADYWIKCIVILSLISFVPYFLINTFGIRDFIYKLPVLQNVNGSSVYSAGLFNVYTYRQDRNISVFWEPAIYASYCIIAMGLEIIFQKKPRLTMLIVCLIGVITSKSTGGIIVLFLLGALIVNKWIVKNNVGTIRELVITLIMIMACIIVIIIKDNIMYLLYSINPDTFYKLLPENSSDSLIVRSSSLEAGLSLLFEKPIFGWGLGNVDTQYALNGNQPTATLLFYLAAFGVFGGYYTFLWLVSLLGNKKIPLSTRLIFLVIIIVVITKEPYSFSCGMYTLLFVLLKEVRNAHQIITEEEA